MKLWKYISHNLPLFFKHFREGKPPKMPPGRDDQGRKGLRAMGFEEKRKSFANSLMSPQ